MSLNKIKAAFVPLIPQNSNVTQKGMTESDLGLKQNVPRTFDKEAKNSFFEWRITCGQILWYVYESQTIDLQGEIQIKYTVVYIIFLVEMVYLNG